MKLQEWMDKNKLNTGFCKNLETNHGLTFSVQASKNHYCTPKFDSDTYRLYDEFEVGFPNQWVSEFMPYAQDRGRPADTVYAYVPVDIIQHVIDKNGGIKEDD